MTLFELPLVAITLATFLGMLLGALWYSPLLFGQQWLRCIGKTPEKLGKTRYL
jgi:hypothetical protein